MNNFSTTLGDATDASSSTQQNLTLLAQTVQKYINIVLGSMAGLLVLAIMIVGAIAWFKASRADSDEERRAQLKKIKWLAGFIVFVVIAWAISGIVTTILQGIWKVQ
ncbi:Mbov_0395 family pilin-like conjugal transfer protein [Metamycoplasma alkalescens]|uniref:Transmembrane protein n=2 Tax=Metamycoplasma alkalescens TaxID=45363 RepID=A0A318U511_9BACT|nr:hypothetical protein [Metamycoplasma alkalescens]PYF43141.1 hypothetical protein BCF88_1046 [Metamycoplasma alkalescens]